MPNEEIEMTPEQVEQEAKSMGWVPLEQFKGNPDNWVEAEEFLDRGKHLMPILQSNNKRLQQQLLQRDQKIDNLTKKLESTSTAIEKLERHYTEANKRAVETAKNSLKAELRQAREDGDIDAEERILGELGDLQQRERDAARQPVKEKKDPPAGETVPSDVQAWYRDNSWFGGTSTEDRAKTKAVTRIAEDLRDEGSELMGREFMDEALRIYEEQQGNPPKSEQRRPATKVENGATRGTNGGGGKSFASLPKEAKEACWEDLDDLVGEGKRYKTQAEWEAAYAKIYYAE